MSDLISRSEAVKIGTDFTFTFEDDKRRYMDFLHYCLNNAPIVETVPVVHGEWIKESMGMRKNINTGELVEKFYCDCSICGYHTGNQGTRFSFCPNCGADMRKKVN